MGTMELMPTSNSMEATSPIDLRALGPVVHVAQMQYQRQIKTLQSLQRQFEITAETNATWRERERRRDERYSQIDQERQTQREELAEYSNRMAEARAARLEAAARHEEALRASAAAKVQAVEERLARFEAERADHAAAERQRIVALEARRDATYRQGQQLVEERRQAALAKERKVEEMLRQRDELRQLQAHIKAEEDFLREQQRRATKVRAEGDLAERLAHFHAKNTAKEETATRRKKELEDLKRLRGEELRQRFEYIAAQAHEAAAVAEAERQALAGRLEDKAARAEALAAQRQALLEEMASLRHAMQRQEEHLRASLLRMRQQGSVTLPEEVVRSLEGLQFVALGLGSGRGSPRAQPLLLGAAPEEEAGGGGAAAAHEGARPRAGFLTPKAARGRTAARRRPKSAGPTPRGIRGVALGGRNNGGPAHPGAAAASPAPGRKRPTSAGAAETAAQHTAYSAVTSPTTPTGPTDLGGADASPYAPYTMPANSTRSRGSAGGGGSTAASAAASRRATLEEQVAAAADTSDHAAEAVASGRYGPGGVHEVARPGSRREEELRAVLQEEIAKESERQAVLAKVTDDDERVRLVKYFMLEREEARRRILALSHAAQAALYH